MPSFDVVSQVDRQEVDNALNQTRKEIGQRYDFKGQKGTLMSRSFSASLAKSLWVPVDLRRRTNSPFG